MYRFLSWENLLCKKKGNTVHLPDYKLKLEDCDIQLASGRKSSKFQFCIFSSKKMKHGLLDLKKKTKETNGSKP